MTRFNVIALITHTASISPDGRTLLSVGDSNKVYFHAISGGSRLTFSPLCVLSLPPPTITAPSYHSNSLAASFSTAFSADGAKFAVASQEGVVTVWDVRSTKPLKVYETDKTRLPSGSGNGGATGWMSDDPWDWTRGSSKAPGWSVRSVKFSAGQGHETMAFTEVCLNFRKKAAYLYVISTPHSCMWSMPELLKPKKLFACPLQSGLTTLPLNLQHVLQLSHLDLHLHVDALWSQAFLLGPQVA